MKIATSAYPLSWFNSFADYEAKLTKWVEEAAGQGAQLLVFPEYGAMELASLGGASVAADQEASLHEAARHRPTADDLPVRLANLVGPPIVAGIP